MCRNARKKHVVAATVGISANSATSPTIFGVSGTVSPCTATNGT